jgi:anti-sigma regulatory factor (Ser/Thr protein kinase)
MPGSAANALAELVVRADAQDARRASEWLAAVAAAGGVPEDHVVRLDQCLDEALANVIMHGGAAALAAAVLLRFDVRRGEGGCSAELVLIDEGPEFDSSAAAAGERPKPASLEDADLGGLGLRMLRMFSDELTYCRREGRNHLTICVRWTEAT